MSARGSVREIGATCRRWTALLAVAALSACGSTAALPGSDGGSTTGEGGGGGAGGAATRDAAGDTGAIETTTSACVEMIQVQCARELACEGAAPSDCLAYTALCPDYYFNADSARTITGLTSCLAAMAARTCTDVVMGVFPSCYVYGRRPAGAGCAYPSQCESGVCETLVTCATCGTGALSNGSTCTTTSECQTGSYCQTGKCIDAGALMHASEGQPCDLQGTPAVGCVGDLICHPTSPPPATAGTCTAPPGAGQPCAQAGVSNDICSAGNACSNITGGTCLASADAGTSPTSQLGTACDSQNPCQIPLLCKSGVCEPLGSASCPVNAVDGGAI